MSTLLLQGFVGMIGQYVWKTSTVYYIVHLISGKLFQEYSQRCAQIFNR